MIAHFPGVPDDLKLEPRETTCKAPRDNADLVFHVNPVPVVDGWVCLECGYSSLGAE